MEYELYHHGVKGMKWGVRRYQNKDGSLTPAGKKRERMSFSERRAAKKELKTQYKEAKTKASNDYYSALNKARREYNAKTERAEATYNKEIAPAAKKRDAALAENQSRYDALKKQTDSYYKNEIDSHMRKAEKHDSEADWWGRDSHFGKEYASKSDKHLNEAAKAEQRHNEASSKNITDHESRTININAQFDHETRAAADRYASALDKADSEHWEKRFKAGEEYYQAKRNAKLNYKQGKKNLKHK